MQGRHSFGGRVIIKDAQDDVVVGTIDRSDKGLRTAKHHLTFGSADVSVCAVHAYIGMCLKVNVEFHINAPKSAALAQASHEIPLPNQNPSPGCRGIRPSGIAARGSRAYVVRPD
jgi:hypothetical protein